MWTFTERIALVLWAETTFIIAATLALGRAPEPAIAITLGSTLGLWLEWEATRAGDPGREDR